jgi:hemerythrin superfamily protein
MKKRYKKIFLDHDEADQEYNYDRLRVVLNEIVTTCVGMQERVELAFFEKLLEREGFTEPH